MTRAIRVVTIVALGLVPAALAPRAVLESGWNSYGNVSNRGILPGNLETRTGFAIGLALGSASSLLGFGIEGLYAQRGVRGATDGDSRKLDYIDVPVYLRATLPMPGIAPYAYAGPQMSFEMHCSAGNVDCPVSDRPKRITAAVLGGGVRIGSKNGFHPRGQYIYGLTISAQYDTSSEQLQDALVLILAGLALSRRSGGHRIRT